MFLWTMLIAAAKYLLRVVPDSTAMSITQALAGRTQKLPVTAIQRAALEQATRFHYGDQRNVAFSWGSGRPVVFVHGWGGHAAQLAPLASYVSQLGFRALAIDVTGHGESPGHRASWSYFLRDIADFVRTMDGLPFALVGHSAGALSMMAARSLRGIGADRYVCICAPSHPFPPINVIQKKLQPRAAVLDTYKSYLAAQFSSTWDALETGQSYLDVGENVLLFYDETDRFVSHSEGDKLKRLMPGAQLVKTHGYSHQTVLEAPELMRSVQEFLRAAPSAS